MYSVGENFYYEIDDEEYEYFVIGDMIIKGKEYIVAENDDHEKTVFIYDDLEEVVYRVEEDEEELLAFWENEFYGTSEDNGLWDDDLESDFEDEEEDFVDIDELDDFDEEEEDIYF